MVRIVRLSESGVLGVQGRFCRPCIFCIIQRRVIDLLIGAAQNQAIADRFVSFFEYPQQAWELISSPERTHALLSQHAIVV